MKRRKHLASAGLFFSLSALACGEARESQSAFTESDSAGVIIALNGAGPVPPCSLAPTPRVSIGVAEGPEEYQLHRVFGATVLSDGRIALVNQGSQQVRYYAPDGTHLLSAGRAGEGPGEFRDAFYLWATPGDTLWVGDYRPFQFLVFSPEGDWIRTVRPRPEYINSPGVMAVLADGRSVLGESRFDRSAPGFAPGYQDVVLHGRDGEALDTIDVLPNGSWGQVGDDQNAMFVYPLFESFTRVEARGRTLAKGHGSVPEFELWDVSSEPVLIRRVRWDAGDRAVSAADVDAAHSLLRAQYADLDPAMVEMLVEPLVSDERPIADEFPAFSGIEIGRDEAVWVRAYSRVGDRSDQTWTRFSPAGRIECTMGTTTKQILEFGPDYILVLDEDELGVERVQLFEWSSSTTVPNREANEDD